MCIKILQYGEYRSETEGRDKHFEGEVSCRIVEKQRDNRYRTTTTQMLPNMPKILLRELFRAHKKQQTSINRQKRPKSVRDDRPVNIEW